MPVELHLRQLRCRRGVGRQLEARPRFRSALHSMSLPWPRSATGSKSWKTARCGSSVSVISNMASFPASAALRSMSSSLSRNTVFCKGYPTFSIPYQIGYQIHYRKRIRKRIRTKTERKRGREKPSSTLRSSPPAPKCHGRNCTSASERAFHLEPREVAGLDRGSENARRLFEIKLDGATLGQLEKLWAIPNGTQRGEAKVWRSESLTAFLKSPDKDITAARKWFPVNGNGSSAPPRRKLPTPAQTEGRA